MKRKLTLLETLQDMITNHAGSISSKIIIGSVTYLLITFSLMILMYVNPEFPGLHDLISVLIITSASLLGLTTIENIKHVKNLPNKEE